VGGAATKEKEVVQQHFRPEGIPAPGGAVGQRNRNEDRRVTVESIRRHVPCKRPNLYQKKKTRRGGGKNRRRGEGEKDKLSLPRKIGGKCKPRTLQKTKENLKITYERDEQGPTGLDKTLR